MKLLCRIDATAALWLLYRDEFAACPGRRSKLATLGARYVVRLTDGQANALSESGRAHRARVWKDRERKPCQCGQKAHHGAKCLDCYREYARAYYHRRRGRSVPPRREGLTPPPVEARQSGADRLRAALARIAERAA